MEDGRSIIREICGLTRGETFASDFRLKYQSRRASVRIMSNIAEGNESQTESLFIRYLEIAKGLCGEVRSQLYVASDQQYIAET